jgi:hypothetical protein
MQLPARGLLYAGIPIVEHLVVGIEGVKCDCFGGPLRCAGNASAVKPGTVLIWSMRPPEASPGNRECSPSFLFPS